MRVVAVSADSPAEVLCRTMKRRLKIITSHYIFLSKFMESTHILSRLFEGLA